jgi:hypothetical protein
MTKVGKRTFGKCFLGNVLDLVNKKIEENMSVIVYLLNIDECKKFKNKLKEPSFIFDAM